MYSTALLTRSEKKAGGFGVVAGVLSAQLDQVSGRRNYRPSGIGYSIPELPSLHKNEIHRHFLFLIIYGKDADQPVARRTGRKIPRCTQNLYTIPRPMPCVSTEGATATPEYAVPFRAYFARFRF